jgi:hypothetical protein
LHIVGVIALLIASVALFRRRAREMAYVTLVLAEIVLLGVVILAHGPRRRTSHM